MEQVVRSLPQAFRIIKEMNLFGDEESDYRSSARESLCRILEDRMRDRIDRHLEGMALRDEEDRRNGFFSRHLLTELGEVLSSFLCKIFIGQFFEERQVLTHFSYRV